MTTRRKYHTFEFESVAPNYLEQTVTGYFYEGTGQYNFPSYDNSSSGCVVEANCLEGAVQKWERLCENFVNGYRAHMKRCPEDYS